MLVDRALPADRYEIIEGFVQEKLAQVLGLPDAHAINVEQGLFDLGLDSLMAVELRNWIEGELRVNLPIVELMQGPTVTRVAEVLLAQLAPAAEGVPADLPKVEVGKNGAVPVSAVRASNGHVGDTVATNGETHRPEEKPDELLENLDQLSDAEVDSMLEALLAEKEQVQ